MTAYNAWVSGFKGHIDSWGPPPLDQITKSFFQTNQYDINIRIPDEGRSPLIPMVASHEITKEGVVMQDEPGKSDGGDRTPSAGHAFFCLSF
jgi:hypothetical protein